MFEGNGMHAPAPAAYLGSADDRLGFPVASFHQDLGAAEENEREGRVFLERRDHLHGFKRRHHCHTVSERVQRPVFAFTQPLGGGVAVDRDQKRSSQRACLGEIRDVAAMQYVEDTVGEHQRARLRGESCRKLLRRTDLLFERGAHQEFRSPEFRSYLTGRLLSRLREF